MQFRTCNIQVIALKISIEFNYQNNYCTKLIEISILKSISCTQTQLSNG